MVRFLRMAVFALPLVVGSVVPTSAATLEIIQGEALISDGAGFSAAASGMTVTDGQLIILRRGGAALLTSDESGCTVSLREAGKFQVPDLSSCNAGTGSVLQPSYNIVPANAGTVVASEGSFGANLTGLGVGFGVAGISAASFVWSVVHNADAPVSSP